jgi:hypothetical protein
LNSYGWYSSSALLRIVKKAHYRRGEKDSFPWGCQAGILQLEFHSIPAENSGDKADNGELQFTLLNLCK